MEFFCFCANTERQKNVHNAKSSIVLVVGHTLYVMGCYWADPKIWFCLIFLNPYAYPVIRNSLFLTYQ